MTPPQTWLILNEATFALMQLLSTEIVKMEGFVILKFKKIKLKLKKYRLLWLKSIEI